MKNVSKKELKENGYIFCAFIVMSVLYYSSSMSYEEQSVVGILETLLEREPLSEWLESIRFFYAGNEISIEQLGYIPFIEFFIRKGAHFVSYCLLGMFWFLGIRNRIKGTGLAILIAILLSAGYASFDELRQAFHPHRTALLEDVALDTFGATTGVFLVWAQSKWKII